MREHARGALRAADTGRADPGQSLEPVSRARFESAFGADLQSVRLHTDESAERTAQGLDALAFTVGSDIFFGPGQFRPQTTEGNRLLAHELAHVVQDPNGTTVRRQAAGATRPLGPRPAIIPSWYSSGDPLARYPVLKEANPVAYAALDATAKSHTLRLSTDPAPEPGWRTQTEVPVAALLRPRLPPAGALATLRDRLWPVLAVDDPDTAAASRVIQDEMVSRWSARNADLLTSQVRVRLLLPDEAPRPAMKITKEALFEVGPQDVLEYTLSGQRLPTVDGSVSLLSLDLLGTNDLEAVVTAVAAEVSTVARAADLRRAVGMLVEAENRYWDDVAGDPDAFALNDVTGHAELLDVLIIVTEPGGDVPLRPGERIRAFLAEHPEYAAELSGSLDALRKLTDRALPVYMTAQQRHQSQSTPDVEFAEMKPDIEATKQRAGAHWDEGEHFVAVCEYMGWGLGKALWGTANTITGDYFSARYEGLTAYRKGAISKDQLEELDRAASGRAVVSVLVFDALMLATAGLGSAVLGTGASLGRTMVVSGVSSAITTAGTMTTTSIYTRQHDFADPTTQQIWRQGAYSPGQIAVSSALSGAIGAAIPVAGLAVSKFVGWLNAVQPGPEVALALRQGGMLAPDLPPPPGWVAEEISPGLFRITHPDVPGEFILTPTSLRFQMPTGTGAMKVEFDLPLTSPAPVPRALLAGPPDLPTAADLEAAFPGAQTEGPLVSTPTGSTLLDIGSGPTPANLGAGDVEAITIIRTDVVERTSVDRVLDATGTLPPDLAGTAQAIFINNPYEYIPNLSELGRAVKPGGKIIIQGNLAANKYFRKLIQQGPPKGFVTSPEESFNPAADLPAAVQADPAKLADVIRRNMLGGPFRYTRGGPGGPSPTHRVVYEKPIEGPEALGKRLAAESLGKQSRFNHIAAGLNALQLGQRNAALAAESATRELGLRFWRANLGDDVVLASVVPGTGKAILVVKPDGTVLRATATITKRLPLDPVQPLDLSDVAEDPPILPR